MNRTRSFRAARYLPLGAACLAMPPAFPGSDAAPSATAATPINIGSRLELFVDRHLIESMDGVILRLHSPSKAPRPKSPLPVRHMVTVIRDGDLFRAWYRGSDSSLTREGAPAEGAEVVHYAESDDGHEWRFPVLRLHEFEGSLENNVVLARKPRLLQNFMPFLDSRPGVDPGERYKALAGHPGPGNKLGLDTPGHGLAAFVSPDGIRWTGKGEVIPYRPQWRHAFDSPNVSFWSEAEQLYVCCFRTWTPGEENLRSISRATSPDFQNWSEPVAMNLAQIQQAARRGLPFSLQRCRCQLCLSTGNFQ